MKVKGHFFTRWGTFILSCILYVAACLLLYAVSFQMYGDVIKTPLIYIVVFPVLAWLGWVLNGGYPENADSSDQDKQLHDAGIKTDAVRKDDFKKAVAGRRPVMELISWWHNKDVSVWHKAGFLFSCLIVFCATLFMVYAVIVDPYTLMVYLYFGVLIVLGFMTFQKSGKKLRLSVMACLIFIVIILITVIYLLAVSPMTVASGRELLEQAGYENVSYEKSIPDNNVIDQIFDNEPQLQSDRADGLGFYLYRCEKNGQTMGAAISVIDKNIVAAEPLDNKSGLSFYINFH